MIPLFRAVRRPAAASGLSLFLLAACTETELGQTTHQQLVLPADQEFEPFRCNAAASSDPPSDGPGGSFRDVVGSADDPALYRASDQTFLYLRMRLSGNPQQSPGNLRSFSWGFLFDTDGDLSTYELLAIADGSGGDRVALEANTAQVAEQASDPAEGVLASYAPSADHWQVAAAPGSSFGGDADVFLTLAVRWVDLEANGIARGSAHPLWAGTGNQPHGIGGDLACHHDGTGAPVLSSTATSPATLGDPDVGPGPDGGPDPGPDADPDPDPNPEPEPIPEPDPDPDPAPGPGAADAGLDFEFGGGGCQTGGLSQGAGLALVLLLLLRIRLRGRFAAGVLAFALVTALALPATAQDDGTRFSVERFRLSVDDGGILDVESGQIPAHKRWGLALWFGHADDPLVVYRRDTGQRIGSIVGQRVGGELVAWFSLYEWIELGAALPLILHQDGSRSLEGSDMPLPRLSAGGIGPLQLIPKVRLWWGKETALALRFAVGLPTGDASDYRGHDGVALTPELTASAQLGRLRLAGNAGYRLMGNGSQETMALTVGDELLLRLGAALAVPGYPVEVALTVAAATSAESPFESNQSALEALVGPMARLNDTISAFAGAGVGLSNGFGTPDWRALVGLRVTGRGGDEPERLPLTLEPEPGPAPQAMDSDGDGVPDELDRCPNAPESQNRVEDDDGCPDQLPDRDQDGLADAVDACPDDPEDMDGFEDQNGCPELDNDADGVLDADDGCPAQAGPVDSRGCPDADRDGDGLVDRLDTCPDQAGSAEHYGCKGSTSVRLTEEGITLLDRLEFASGSAALEPSSRVVLDSVAQVMASHPELRIEVHGHTDSAGPVDVNLDLSRRRAERVVAYLVERGVAADRLGAVGHGAGKPRYDNSTRVGRAANRRVELVRAQGSSQAPAPAPVTKDSASKPGG